MPLTPATLSAPASGFAMRRIGRGGGEQPGERAGGRAIRVREARAVREVHERSVVAEHGRRHLACHVHAARSRAAPSGVGADRLGHHLGREVVAVTIHEAHDLPERVRLHAAEDERACGCPPARHEVHAHLDALPRERPPQCARRAVGRAVDVAAVRRHVAIEREPRERR